MEGLLIGIFIGFLARVIVDALGSDTRVSHGHQPNTPPRDWSKVRRPQGSAVQPPMVIPPPDRAGIDRIERWGW